MFAGLTALHLAVKHGFTDVIECLAQHGVSLELSRDTQRKDTPLFYACFNGWHTSAAKLLEMKADPNTVLTGADSVTWYTGTALHAAIHRKSLDCIRVLLAGGIDCSVQNPLLFVLNQVREISLAPGFARRVLSAICERGDVNASAAISVAQSYKQHRYVPLLIKLQSRYIVKHLPHSILIGDLKQIVADYVFMPETIDV